MAVSDFNPIAPETLECPYPFYEALHAEAPVYVVPGMAIAIVSKYDLIQQVVHDTEAYSSAMPTGPTNLVKAEDEDPDVRALREQAARRATPTLLSADPPIHGRYRSIVNRAFAARRVAGMESYVREIVTEAIDAFIGEGKFDMVAQFAERLPMAVIADQIGVPRDQLTEFKRRSDVAIGGIETRIPPDRAKEAARAGRELEQYFLERAEERREDPKDDMLTVLATALLETEEGPRRLNDAEILSIVGQFQVAGKETTAHELGSAMLLLVEHPGQMARLKADPSLVPNFVEEALRMESPVRGLFRTTTRDVELAGVALPAGTTVMLSFAAANRDNDEFEDAATFDVCRENAKSHLAFSAGPHYCVAAALARLELRVAFEELLTRLTNIRLDPDYPPPTHEPSYILRGLNELHLLFDRA